MWPRIGGAIVGTAVSLAVLVVLADPQPAEALSREGLAGFLNSHLNSNGEKPFSAAPYNPIRQQKLEGKAHQPYLALRPIVLIMRCLDFSLLVDGAPDNSSKKTVLVTGAAGFIGFHLTNLLNDRGYQLKLLLSPTSLHAF